MQAKDFIQLLKLTPKMPVKVEYLPGLFTDGGFTISKIAFKKNEAVQVYLSDNKTPGHLPHTEELKTLLIQSVGETEELGNMEIRVIYGNQDIESTELDITEVEVFQGTFTLKLYSLNNLTKAKARQEKQQKEQMAQKGKRFFFHAVRNFLFPQPLVLKWNLAKL
ncbi:hypothetical protein [Echinicola vietnamensis]|uniref:Uncharacterized protein n=1 Tax=Echinicola vietnamensis (strain DSM 17526 / LMG 23754 / KMM 6221) TaxID=926556 RepID=L0G2U8_ECHVK|nr:hypothetical protein [Echinicola vietnamensis]AGA79170.1 hypothetical protein Echvi_2932 [Echinicola vietnamensis DSM 17526]